MSSSIEGKTAIITGAGSGMGLDTARLFHKQGVNLVLADFSISGGIGGGLGDRAVPIRANIKAADAKAIWCDWPSTSWRTRHPL